jgi:hypothetical protein
MAINKGSSQSVVVTNSAEDNEAINLSKVEETRNQFDLAEAKQQYEIEIKNSDIIDKLTSQIYE